MNRYVYDGPVTMFGTCIEHNWHGETIAPSESKARSNLAYQYKQRIKRNVKSSIQLPGKIIMTEEGL